MSNIISIHRSVICIHFDELHYIDTSFCNLYTFWWVTLYLYIVW